VPSNDGVRGSVNSSKIAGLPGVVQFVLGAAQVLTSELSTVDGSGSSSSSGSERKLVLMGTRGTTRVLG
jgi:hypothetical protein